MTPPCAVIFDLDGTLVDSAPSLHAAAAATLAERGLPAPDRATVTRFIGDGMAALIGRCLDWAGAAPDEAAVARFLALYGADPAAGTAILPGAREALAALAARGLRLGLCTNKPEELALRLVGALALGPFDAVVGGDTLDRRKPDPAPLLHAARLLGARPDAALFVGDSAVDQRTAAAAGIAYLQLDGGYGAPAPPDLPPPARVATLSGLADVIARGGDARLSFLNHRVITRTPWQPRERAARGREWPR